MSLINNSNLTPATLYGKGDNGNVSMEVSPNGIVLGGDLNTATPITATISQAGIITDNVTGFNILSSLNMNQNDITNCYGISNGGSNLNLSSIGDDVNISSGGGALINLNAGNQLNLNSNDLVNMTTLTQINITAINDNIILTAPNGIYINASSGGGGDGDIYASTFTGSLNGNANTATTATNATTASLATQITTTNTTANATHYLDFSDSSLTGNGSVQKTAGLSCNPSTNTITATTFNGNLNGTSSSSTNSQNSTIIAGNNLSGSNWYPCVVSASTAGNYNLNSYSNLSYTPNINTFSCNISGNSTTNTITDDNTNATFYPVFVSNNTGNLPLKVDKTTNPLSYNPSTGNLSATSYTITGTPSTASVASTFGQVGLVYIGAVQVAITGSASTQSFSFASLFNSTYKNYRITLAPTTQVSYTAYPSYSLGGFLGTSVPTIASLYGFELTSASSSSVVAIYTAGATLSSTPLAFTGSALPNRQVQFDILNVGFANTSTNVVSLLCKSIYGNPGVSGISDRTITCSSLSGATITGLTITQSSLGVGNNMTLEATIYGYNPI